MKSLTTIVGVVGSVAIAGLAITAFSNKPSGETNASITASKANVVRVSGEDFKFDAPDSLPPGLTEFRFMNKGPSIHHMSLLKLEEGKTIQHLTAALSDPNAGTPEWVREVGGPNAPDPGKEANATLMLHPGNYALICFVDIGGPPHFTKGMIRPLHVYSANHDSDAKPKADLTLTLFDYNFKESTPIKAGTRTLEVHNGGPQIHEVEMIKLAPGKTVDDFFKWFDKMEGPPPGSAIGGISSLESGMTEYFTADFTPGNYVFLCFVGDEKDHKPHFAHGMVKTFSVE